MTKLAWHNDAKLKETYMERMRAHAAADEIIQGTYWQNGKGCAIGCLMESDSPHKLIEEVLGIEERISRLIDRLFEGLPNDKAKLFAVVTPDAIPVGADLSLVTPKFLVWLLEDVKCHAKNSPDVLTAINNVQELYARVIRGEVVTDDEWASAAEAAAWAAWAAWAASAAANQYEKMADKLIELLSTTKSAGI